MRGKLGTVEVRGGELIAAAEAHDALYPSTTGPDPRRSRSGCR